jgi:hypothetical protein
MRAIRDIEKGRFLQFSRQSFASCRGKLMGQVTAVVASCGAIKVGNLDFRAPGNFLMLGRVGISAGVSHTRDAEGYLE